MFGFKITSGVIFGLRFKDYLRAIVSGVHPASIALESLVSMTILNSVLYFPPFDQDPSIESLTKMFSNSSWATSNSSGLMAKEAVVHGGN